MRRLIPALRFTLAAALFTGAAPFCTAATPEEAIAALQAAYARSVTPGEVADAHRDLLAAVVQRVQRSHAREVDFDRFLEAALKSLEGVGPGTGEPAAVFKKAANDALRAVDAHARYIDAETQSAERSESNGFGGVGLEVESRTGGVGVLASMPGTPAARAGLRPGDLIVRVDDQPVQDLALGDAISRMRGLPGTNVSITVRRGVGDEFTVALTRETIRRPVLRWSMEADVLVLKLSSFSGPVLSTLEAAVEEALALHAPSAVVLDLRGNPGGLLREAVLVADAFLTQGEIVSVRGRTASNERTWNADPRELLPGLPMVVMVDGRSASASEIVAAALQDNGRAVVIGQRSYGKGTVQTTYSLGERKGALKLTTSLFYAPSGRAMQGSGVAPDIHLVAAAQKDEAPAETGAPSPAARIEQGRCAAALAALDPALACAVAYLRVGNVGAFMAMYGAVAP
ncbi:S41 family peptidase [Ramlibacter albus]|uniref:S41 family peptidase n=1 Tax=Ramlibacter albus TaxID=2079448 RepID=A0A923MC82_9BURK|nr:S41 family peptidase [Ramlibacter albus]MBC5767305.1 S41 family peptidase [Ramlibacter albus]